MIVEIKVPEVGESITEGVLVAWSAEDGQQVAMDDPLFELETDKITLTVQAVAAGRLSVGVPAGEKVRVGQVVGTIDTDAAATKAPQPPARPAPAEATPAEAAPALGPADHAEALSPAVRRLVAEHQLDPGQISASGKGGRLTKEDVLRHLERGAAPPAEAPPAPAPAPAPAAKPADGAGRQETRRPMSSLRQRIAERLVAAQHTAAMLTTFNEADMSQVIALRERHRDDFEKRHGVRLGFMSFFVRAALEALRELPVVNSRIDGESIVEPQYHDIGVAVATDFGLVVPVIRDADRLSFAEIERVIADFARRARDRKLELNELVGGTFTISNGGVYGSLLSTPILNPPQSGILGLHAIKKRPVVVDDQIAIRPMMYLAMSYDHRLVDGRDAVTFLKKIVECIEHPERIWLDLC
jgi:2-oxoglutarate dehydrogenase E2 component (dihydrolipoamide succinyltransferase)